jgi:sialic acid synthase SpsE
MRDRNVDIIAELGINHDGDFDKAVRMVQAAKLAGVKIVKFQHYDAEKLLGKDSPYYEYANKCQFTKWQHERLKAFCDAIGMEYLVSVFDIADVAWADGLCKRHKVASRMNKDTQFIAALEAAGKELIISINEPFLPAQKAALSRYMYCVTQYPTPEKELANLPCNAELGLSSHCPTIRPSLTAVAQGANLIEHHVKFAGDEEGCDKSSSITFDDLARLHVFVNELEIV